jgi:cobalt-zinc-cadmium efflux system protein
MESIPDGYDSDEIINAMKSVEGVIDVHENHIHLEYAPLILSKHF